MSEPLLDEANKRIVTELQRDGRMSYAALTKVVGLSEAAVRQRVQRLLDHGVIKVEAVTDPQALGLHRQAMVGLAISGDVRSVADALTQLPEVSSVVLCAGPADLLVELVCVDDDHLLTLLNDTIRGLPGVTGAQTYVYLKQTKHSHAWGVTAG
jgi:Lrp/AsnC family transcriptional regulator for asnA, asnC and gidA